MDSSDTAAQPLIHSEAADHDHDHDTRYSAEDGHARGVDGAVDGEMDEAGLTSPTLFIWTLTLCAGISGLLFGYEYVPLPFS